MIFEIRWEKRALHELEKLEHLIIKRIYGKVDELKNGFKSKDIKKVKGHNLFRLRIGDYRVIFYLEKNIISILKVAHRKNIYKFYLL